MGVEGLSPIPDEREYQKKDATKKRIVVLAVVFVVSLGAKFAIKPPPPPKAPDHSARPFRAIPGVLKNLSDADRNKLTPQQIAMLEEADRNVLLRKSGETAIAQIPSHTPASAAVKPTAISGTIQTVPQTTSTASSPFLYKTAEKDRWVPPTPSKQDLTADTVVLFNRGGHLLAQDAERVNGSVGVTLNKTMFAKFSKSSIRQVIHTDGSWKSPIPKGFIELKPAKGITILVSRQTGRRITIKKDENAI